MEYELPPLPETPWQLHMPAQPYESAWTSTEDAYTEEQMKEYAQAAIDKYRASFPKCRVADVGFHWNADRYEHIPKLVVEFDAVPFNEPNDSKGWRDRDALAELLSQPKQKITLKKDTPNERSD